MIVACTACHTRFEAAGYRDVHCPSCGALAQPATVKPCPRCDLPLAAREVSDLVVDECSGCQGVFLDDIAVHRVIDQHDHARAEALVAALPKTPKPTSGGRMYVKCPTCTNMMNRKLFATGSGIVVDVCKAHGTFFDGGELPAIIAFVRNGGLAIAAKKDAQRAGDSGRAERPKVRSTTNVTAGDVLDGGSALIDLLSALFD
jgi:Zn-finger nucleic acid-binding protein